MRYPYFTHRTPCMDDPLMFDREVDGETPEQSNARMEQASRICKTACPEFATCRSFHTPTNRPPGVVAGLYRKRNEPRKTAVWGRYSQGDPCSGCGSPMMLDPDLDLPNGWVLRYRGDRCKDCEQDRINAARAQKRRVSA